MLLLLVCCLLFSVIVSFWGFQFSLSSSVWLKLSVSLSPLFLFLSHAFYFSLTYHSASPLSISNSLVLGTLSLCALFSFSKSGSVLFLILTTCPYKLGAYGGSSVQNNSLLPPALHSYCLLIDSNTPRQLLECYYTGSYGRNCGISKSAFPTDSVGCHHTDF